MLNFWHRARTGMKKVVLSFCTLKKKSDPWSQMYSLPNGIWKSKDFSQPVQFSILKDTLAVFSAYKTNISKDLLNISTWISQYHFKFISSIICLPTLLFLLFPIPVTMPPFTKLRIFDSLNFVVLFFTVCLTCIHLFPKCFWVCFSGPSTMLGTRDT